MNYVTDQLNSFSYHSRNKILTLHPVLKDLHNMVAACLWDFILYSPPHCSLSCEHIGFLAILGACQVCFCLRALALVLFSA